MKTRLCFALGFFAVLAPLSSAESTPVRIKQTVEAQFPPSLAHSSILVGSAYVLINVDSDGNLADLMVTGYTEPAFADAAVTALKSWQYAPATQDGRPVGTRVQMRFDFSGTGRVVAVLSIDTPDMIHARATPTPLLFSKVAGLRDLDQPISLVKPFEPVRPGNIEVDPSQSHSVVIDFYIDETGKPRMPVVTNNTHPAFAEAAISALIQSRFSVPTRGGKPVAVRVQQEIIFPTSS